MTETELYREIGVWINRYHRRRWLQTGLLKDFQHDLWISLREKEETTASFIKKSCYLYPHNAVRYRYYKRQKDFGLREVVLLDDEQQPLTDFADNSFNPEYEFPRPTKPKKKGHKDAKRLKVTYRNGQVEEFDSAVILATELGVNRRKIYSAIGKPLAGRYTKRKMSHIQLIEYIDEQSL